ncbi:putative two-component system sensor kinase [Alloactinosynnema sp. L-07]|uniref:sensor histidine kinase n=1 Tax=Alloactinosynnema sp. L-07 TaxID=1653480 RepID=UPI00065EF175|nr:sensor histidine kinase [Alloactinosynnema sp. L-07]CRK56619.1 putative two-component system sensor kinase [Alloactinosynnema sp. L-07]
MRRLEPLWRRTSTAFLQVCGGLATSALALLALLWLTVTIVASLIGVGLLLLPGALRTAHGVAQRERARLRQWGVDLVEPAPWPTGVRTALADTDVRRELAWLAGHATGGFLLGVLGVMLPLSAVRDLTFPAWWTLLPADEVASATLWFWVVRDWTGAWLVTLSALVWLALTVLLTPSLARLQMRRGRLLLGPLPGTDIPQRIAELTATRAAALDAHAVELRRIERALHDSTQNTLVAVTVLIGAARRTLERDPSQTDELLGQAQTAAEKALSELRSVARGILPPVLADRGLDGALTSLAAHSVIPTTVHIDLIGRCPASVESSAYFAVSEAMTNVARHSGARHATVTVNNHGGRLRVRVTDDGAGGAAEGGGTGLTGIRQRVEAHDGTFLLTSPLGGPTTLEVDLPCGS